MPVRKRFFCPIIPEESIPSDSQVLGLVLSGLVDEVVAKQEDPVPDIDPIRVETSEFPEVEIEEDYKPLPVTSSSSSDDLSSSNFSPKLETEDSTLTDLRKLIADHRREFGESFASVDDDRTFLELEESEPQPSIAGLPYTNGLIGYEESTSMDWVPDEVLISACQSTFSQVNSDSLDMNEANNYFLATSIETCPSIKLKSAENLERNTNSKNAKGSFKWTGKLSTQISPDPHSKGKSEVLSAVYRDLGVISETVVLLKDDMDKVFMQLLTDSI